MHHLGACAPTPDKKRLPNPPCRWKKRESEKEEEKRNEDECQEEEGKEEVEEGERGGRREEEEDRVHPPAMFHPGSIFDGLGA